jgi:hypothetical protein
MFSIGDHTIVIGTIARLHPVKDLDMLVRAVCEAAEPAADRAAAHFTARHHPR